MSTGEEPTTQRPSWKSVLNGLDSRELRKETEVAFLRLGQAEGWALLLPRIKAGDLKPRQLANGIRLLAATRGPGDAARLFPCAVEMLCHDDQRVRSSAALTALLLLCSQASPPDLTAADREKAKARLRQAQMAGLDERADRVVSAFFDGTLAW